jgi:ribosomal protein S18 acetylase RimI-like enzyme
MKLHPLTAEIALREATPGDYDFAQRVHHGAMRPYVEPLFGWDEAFQGKRFREKFSAQGACVILRGGAECGWVQIVEGEDAVYLSQLFILAEHQGRGTGSAVLTGLLARWRPGGKAVRLGVLKNNPARRLYERFGFKVVAEEEHRLEMELRQVLP